MDESVQYWAGQTILHYSCAHDILFTVVLNGNHFDFI